MLATMGTSRGPAMNTLNWADWNPFALKDDLRYVWDRIPAGGITMLVADSGIGKSMLAQHLAISLAQGRNEFLGKQLDGKTRQVIYVDLEGTPTGTKQRLFQMGLNAEDLDRLHFKRPRGFRVEEHIAHLVNEAEQLKPDLIVIDSFAASHRLLENDHASMQKYFDDHLRLLTEASPNTAVVLLAHTNKTEGGKTAQSTDWHLKYRGSSAIWAAVDCVYCLGKSTKGQLALMNTKSKDASAADILLLEIDVKAGGLSPIKTTTNGGQNEIHVPTHA
ncbi:MAG: hypothetical protein EXQ67_01675 [Thermoleophilia bacterium]|nr:hypothetical protein [Thermoleophilia bacterium]